MKNQTLPEHRKLEECVKLFAEWQTEKETNKYGMAHYADRAIILIEKEIELLKGGKSNE